MRTSDWISIALILMFLVAALFLVFYIKTEGATCLLDSGRYTANSLAKQNDGQVTCSCYLTKIGFQSEPIKFYSES